MEERAEDIRDVELQARILEKEELLGIMVEVLDLHGNQPAKKQDGLIWVMYENVNRIN